jgi:drug/metabolite transporter (DMT)-like permease
MLNNIAVKSMKWAYIQLALSMCLVGINIAVGKIIISSVPIFLFSDIRFIIASLVLVPLLVKQGEIKFELNRKEWLILFLQAFFGVFLFSIFMLYGVRYTSAISAGIITSTTPACIAFIALVFLGEKLNLNNTLSICFAVLGISLISFPGLGHSLKNTGIGFGSILIIAAVISEALFTIFAKRLSTRLKPLQMAAMVNLFGFLLFIPFSVQQVMSINIKITSLVWLLIFYYSLTASVVSFVLWYRGVAKVPANIAGLFTVFMPVSSALIGVVFLHECFTMKHLMGMAFAITAIYIGIRTYNNKGAF